MKESLPTLKVLTLNTHKGFTALNRRFVLSELREAVRGISADLVFLQEVVGAHSKATARPPGWTDQPHYEFLADSIWGDFAYGKNAVYPAGHHGNALLSKFPILLWENHDVSIAGPEQRGLLYCKLELPGHAQALHTICVHLGLMEAHRQRQVRMMCELIAKRVPADAPLVVAGDFNDWRVRAHAPLAHGALLREAFVEMQGRAAKTFPVRFPLLRLDRIYFRNLRVMKAEVHSLHPWSHLSDHAGLSAEIQL
jgi:endonuclease/exonuclease/phosphatase family metal-dependent hydrolase